MADHSNIHFLSDPAPFREKERLYLEARRREGRIFPDDVVRKLPFISKSNPYAKEWCWRKRSFARFLSSCKELSALRFPSVERTVPYRMTKRILDLGCGNGWLANRLAENPDWEVWAVDLNQEELAQGARLFGRENLRFVYADILQDVLPEGHFDVVVMAAAVQYFPDLKTLTRSLHKTIKPNGEIHIFDSPFYKSEMAQMAAKRRTLEYYSKIGLPEMADFYHHHLWKEMQILGGANLNSPLHIRFLQKVKWLGPFAWIRVRSL
jgi:ubiquinone/menaquinone biosynthesis C-methylase UbiE